MAENYELVLKLSQVKKFAFFSPLSVHMMASSSSTNLMYTVSNECDLHIIFYILDTSILSSVPLVNMEIP